MQDNILFLKFIFKDTLLNIYNNTLSLFLITVTTANTIICRESPSETLTIIAISVLNALSETYQEYKKIRINKELKEFIKCNINTLVEGKLISKSIGKIGDTIYIQNGDRIMYDTILIDYQCDSLNFTNYVDANESLVNGESFPIKKITLEQCIYSSEDKNSMRMQNIPPSILHIIKSYMKNDSLFIKMMENNVCIDDAILKAGSFVLRGSKLGIIINDDDKLQEFIGKPEKSSNLINNARDISMRLTLLVSVLCLGLFVLALYKGGSRIGALKISISLALTVIPAGLDASCKIIMLFMSRRLMKRKIYINNYLKLETLGDIDIICLDKTGTLTHNMQKLVEIQEVVQMKDIILLNTIEGDKLSKTFENDIIYGLFKYCNEALTIDGQYSGDPLDCAMMMEADKYIKKGGNVRRCGTIPFCPIKKTIEVEIELVANNKRYILIKGAPENILRNSNSVFIDGKIIMLTEGKKQQISDKIINLGLRGFRIIGCAFSEVDCQNLTFICIILFHDPIRKAVRKSIEWCKANNIEIKIITGDSLETTRHVCEEIGLLDAHKKVENDLHTKECFEENLNSGSTRRINSSVFNDIDEITTKSLGIFSGDEVEKFNMFNDVHIVYRAEPRHKAKIIEFYKNKGKSVLMTGDGLNDIVAMKESNISIAMGTGSHYCKEMSDIVLLDDNFDNIVECITAGRKSLHNIYCLYKYLLSSNFGELLAVFLSFIFCSKECLSSSNLLLVNLITDGLPVIAICFNEGHESNRKINIDFKLIFRCFAVGFYMGFMTFMVYVIRPKYVMESKNIESLINTRCTLFIIFCELMNTLNNVNLRKSIIYCNIWKMNKYVLPLIMGTILLLLLAVTNGAVRSITGFERVTVLEFVHLLALSFPIIVIDEALKLI